MDTKAASVEQRELINTKYHHKIGELARQRPDQTQSEVEQQFLLCCRQASDLFNAEPPTPFLRQVAWRWLTAGPRVAKQYAKA